MSTMTLTIRLHDDANDELMELQVDVPFNEPDDLMWATNRFVLAIEKEFEEVRRA